MNDEYTISERGARMTPVAYREVLAEIAGIHDSLRRLVAIATLAPAAQSSVQIEQAAKPGSPPRYTVKVYDEDPDVAATKACALYDQLVTRPQVFPADAN